MSLTQEVLVEARRERRTPILETERLALRAPRPEDVTAIVLLANDRRIAENTARLPHPYGVSDAEHFVAIANKRASEACFVITLDDTLIGACGVDPREDGPELGYWLGASYWGQGYATEAVRAAIDHAFGDLQHETLQAGARVSNPASRRVLEKCAFQWTGVRLSRIRAINSAAPVDRFRLDRKLWVLLKRWGPVRRVAQGAWGFAPLTPAGGMLTASSRRRTIMAGAIAAFAFRARKWTMNGGAMPPGQSGRDDRRGTVRAVA